MVTPQWLRTKGGPTNTVYNLKRNLEGLAHSVSIVTREQHPDVFSFSNTPLLREMQIVTILRGIRPDVVHVHGRLHYLVPAIIYQKLFNRRARIVFTFHTQPRCRQYLVGSSAVKVPYKGVQAVIGRYLLGFCTITSVSDSLVQAINQNCDMTIDRYSVIQSGAAVASDAPVDHDLLRHSYGLNGAAPVLYSIGVLSWDWKVAGHKIVIEAVAILRNRYPGVKLLIAGDGPYRAFLEEIVAELGLQSHVVFCGNLENPSALFAVADLYVHMALNEGSPLSIIEAMMAGSPIIAANRGGIPEIIKDGNTGILIEPTAMNLAESMIELLADDEKRARLGENAREYARANLSWRKIAAEYLSLYEQGDDRG
jgi:glycosyltransferase involved in cell wall biosynthesis